MQTPNAFPRTALAGITVAAVLAVTCHSAMAVTSTWSSSADGNWSQASRWSPFGVPDGPLADVFINNDLPAVTVTLDSPRTVRSIEVGFNDKLIFSDGSDLTVGGASFVNGESVEQNGATSSTDLRIGSSSLTVSGTGEWAMSDSPFNRITALSAGSVFINDTNHTFRGSGSIGSGLDLGILNRGTILAEGVTGLTLRPGPTGNAEGSFDTVNRGVIDAGASSVVFAGPQSIDNTGGVLRTSGFGGQITIESTVSEIRGGTIEGDVFVEETTGFNLADISVGPEGRFHVEGSEVDLEGAVTFGGGGFILGDSDTRFNVPAQGYQINGPGYFYTGAGDGAWFFNADGGASTFRYITINEGAELRKSARIGVGDRLGIINHGLVQAYSSDAIRIYPGVHPNGNPEILNTGEFRADDYCEIRFRQCRIDNDGGIFTTETGAREGFIILEDNVTLDGGHIAEGNLKVDDEATFVEITDLSIGTEETGALALVPDDTSVKLGGTITFAGPEAGSSQFETRGFVILHSPTTLTGKGWFYHHPIVDGTIASGYFGQASMPLTIGEEVRFWGDGEIGQGDRLAITNYGRVEGSSAGLILDPGDDANAQGTADIYNAETGVLRAGARVEGLNPGYGNLSIRSGSVRNDGLLEAVRGGMLDFEPGATLESLTEGALVSGAYSMASLPSTTDASTIDLGAHHSPITTIGSDAEVRFHYLSEFRSGGEKLSETITDIEGKLLLEGRDMAPFGNVRIPGQLTLSGESNFGFAAAGHVNVTFYGTSTLEFLVAAGTPPEIGKVETSGTAHVDGRLEVVLERNDMVSLGQEFVIVEADQVEGTFDETAFAPELINGLGWEVEYRDTQVIIRVVDETTTGTDGPAEWVDVTNTTVEEVAPNPFAPSRGDIQIRFALAEDGPVRLAVHAADGRRVRVLADESMSAGRHSRNWNGSMQSGLDAPAGVYFAVMEAGGKVETQKMILTR